MQQPYDESHYHKNIQFLFTFRDILEAVVCICICTICICKCICIYRQTQSVLFPNQVHIWSSGCVICTQLSIKLNSISGGWQAIWGMFLGFSLQTNHHIPLCKLNTKPRSQNDFPACIFLPLWTLGLRAQRRWGWKSWKQHGWKQERKYCYFVIHWHFRHF